MTESQTQGGIDELTDGERAVIEADEAERAAAAAAKAAADAPAPEAAPEVPPVVEAPVLQAQAPVAVAPTINIEVPAELAARDFAAERAALKAAMEEGDLLQSEYDEKRDAITAAETERRLLQAIGSQISTQTAAHNAQVQAQTFEDLSVQLMQRPENADLADPTRNKLFQSLVDRIDAETGRKLGNAELLGEAYKQFRAVVPGMAAAPAGPPSRTPDLSGIPPRLASAPSASTASPVHHDVGALANLSIEDAESALMRMSGDQIEQLLLKTPGSYSVVEKQA
jgi:hypothetical protein